MESVSISYPGNRPQVIIHAQPYKIFLGHARMRRKKKLRAVVGVTYGPLVYSMVKVAADCLMSQDRVPEMAIFDSKIQVGLSVSPATPECQVLVDKSMMLGSFNLKISAFHIDAQHAIDPEDEAFRAFKESFDRYGTCTLWLAPSRCEISKAEICATVREIKSEPLKFF